MIWKKSWLISIWSAPTKFLEIRPFWQTSRDGSKVDECSPLIVGHAPSNNFFLSTNESPTFLNNSDRIKISQKAFWWSASSITDPSLPLALKTNSGEMSFFSLWYPQFTVWPWDLESMFSFCCLLSLLRSVTSLQQVSHVNHWIKVTKKLFRNGKVKCP